MTGSRFPIVPAGIAILLLTSQVPLWAYNPPADTAGPLTARIQGPAVVTQLETAVPVQVILENHGSAPLSGTVAIRLVDPWRAEPGGPVNFSLPAHGRESVAFSITAGKGTYNAHYPVHGLARFEQDGTAQVAHPILIFQTNFKTPPRAEPAAEWKPAEMPADGALALWSLPAHRAIVEPLKGPTINMPVGWHGSEPRSGAIYYAQKQTASDQPRDAIIMHPPWRNGLVGTIVAEFPLRLPQARPLRLSFANAVQPEGHGDGVTFRVRAVAIDAAEGTLGKVLFERHTAAKTWQPGEADLGAYAGQTVRVQLESHPGPSYNTGWDLSYWGTPTLIAGTPPAPRPFPPSDPGDGRLLGTLDRGATHYDVRVWPGARGLLDAAVGFTSGSRRLYFHGFEVHVLKAPLHDPASPVFLLGVKEEPCPGGCQFRHQFQSFLGSFDLVGRLDVDRGVLRARFHLENVPEAQPWRVVYLEDVSAGPWSAAARQVYAGQGNVLREPQTFELGFDGHALSTSFVGFDFPSACSIVQGCDVPPDHLEVSPDSRRYSLHVPHASVLTFIPAENVWEGVKLWRQVNGLRAAGGVGTAAGRFVFDLWGGRYRPTADALREAFRYGLTDSLVVFHGWQRWGYDYRLPDVYPPNPGEGTLEDMRALAATCKKAGVRFAPHDNYIDFYPDAEDFSYDRFICFQGPGRPVRAWLNEGRDAQSYRFRADQVAPFVQRNLQQIRDGFAPTAYFIDVWSSIRPYDYWTADGRFFDRVSTRTIWGRQFAWIRDYLGGDAPQISESGHDQLVGWLDGGQTNHLRVDRVRPGKKHWCVWDIRCADAERIPWSDAAHHDRFVLHGAGYPGRYEGGLDPREHGIYSDDYLATEVLTGHPAMGCDAFGRDVVRKYWLLHGLGRALALHTIEGVEFADDCLHHQHVRWSGGGEVWVNRGPSDWMVAGATLPEYGFIARVPTATGSVEASIARREGLIVETARAAEDLYVNARPPADGPLAIGLRVENIVRRGPRYFEIKLRWQADEPIPAGWSPFFHFVDERKGGDGIVFQAGHEPGTFTTQQQGTLETAARFAVPAEYKAGQSVELRYGIYHAREGRRLTLAGSDDGGHRIRLGTIRLEGSGERVTGVTWIEHPREPDPLLQRLNPAGKAIDFGAIITAGGCRATRQGKELWITPLPQRSGPKFTAQVRWNALPWSLPPAVQCAAIGADGKILFKEPVRREGDLLLIDGPPETFAYRLGP
jgi:hypothetical protein